MDWRVAIPMTSVPTLMLFQVSLSYIDLLRSVETRQSQLHHFSKTNFLRTSTRQIADCTVQFKDPQFNPVSQQQNVYLLSVVSVSGKRCFKLSIDFETKFAPILQNLSKVRQSLLHIKQLQ